jgi:acyl carrier protein
MAGREKVRREVLQLIAEIAELPMDKISMTATFSELDIDSLNGLRLVAEMEQRYYIHIPDEDVGKITTIAQVMALVDAHEPQD